MPSYGRRSRRRIEQRTLWDTKGMPAPGQGDLVPTQVLLRDRSCARVLEMIRQVRVYFPELDGESIKVGRTRAAAGLASREEPSIWINPHRLTRHTIAHEIVHLLQARGQAPSGEKSADLYALARHPVLADDVPFYLATPGSLREACRIGSRDGIPLLLHQVASDALVHREGGHRSYLRWFETELDRRWNRRQVEASFAGLATAPMQTVLF